MNLDAFLTCVGYFGLSTGASNSLEGVYSFSSGTTGIIYNSLYTTGSHFNNGIIVGADLPLINATQRILSNNFFSGLNCYHVGYQHTGNFGLILDIESSGCLKRSQSNGKDGVLVSTIVNHSGFGSGFIIGINDANRIYFRTQGLQYTIEKELSLHDFVYVGLANNQYINFGIFNVSEDTLYSKNVVLSSPLLNTPDIFIGSFRNNTLINDYNGYYGKINQAILFNDTLTASDINTCVDCSFATDYIRSTGTFSSSGFQITGTLFSGIQQLAITGQSNYTGNVQRNDGTIVSVIVQSGITGLVTTGELAVPLLNNVALSGFRNQLTFLYDTGSKQSFGQFSINFDLTTNSGDVIEVYTYNAFNSNVSLLFDSVTWPTGNGFSQLIGNGLAETSGVDFFVNRNIISGFTTDDILMYDMLIGPTVVTDYSGYWQQSRIPLSGGFFPSTSQYYEPVGFTGQVWITGLSGICTGNIYYPNFGYDLYMNGQKLISGLQYAITPSGSGFVINLSGANLPEFSADIYTEPMSGLVTGVANIHDSELTFMPQFSGFTRYLFTPTGDVATFGTITGFSEQVWVNGVRQMINSDYAKIVPCQLISGFQDIPSFTANLYDSRINPTGYWKLTYPPQVSITDNFFSGLGGVGPVFEIDWGINLQGYPSGDFIEVYVSQTSGPATFDYQFLRLQNTSDNLTVDEEIVQGGSACFRWKFRYHSGNCIGAFILSDEVCS